jgi:hypothetical protein
MFKKLFLLVAASIAFILPLQSQTYAISRQKGNKIVLLGEHNAGEMGKWRQIIDADGVYEHGFALLDRAGLTTSKDIMEQFTRIKDIGAFEAWFRQRYGLSSTAKWAALDLGNNLIVTGVQTPTAKEFEQMLDQRGVRSPLRQLRDFLRENSGHREAMAGPAGRSSPPRPARHAARCSRRFGH